MKLFNTLFLVGQISFLTYAVLDFYNTQRSLSLKWLCSFSGSLDCFAFDISFGSHFLCKLFQLFLSFQMKNIFILILDIAFVDILILTIAMKEDASGSPISSALGISIHQLPNPLDSFSFHSYPVSWWRWIIAELREEVLLDWLQLLEYL